MSLANVRLVLVPVTLLVKKLWQDRELGISPLELFAKIR